MVQRLGRCRGHSLGGVQVKKISTDENFKLGGWAGFTVGLAICFFGALYLEGGGRHWIITQYREWSRARMPASISEICAPQVKGSTGEIIEEYQLTVNYWEFGPQWHVTRTVKTGGRVTGIYEIDVDVKDADLGSAVRECARRIERLKALDSAACGGGGK